MNSVITRNKTYSSLRTHVKSLAGIIDAIDMVRRLRRAEAVLANGRSSIGNLLPVGDVVLSRVGTLKRSIV